MDCSGHPHRSNVRYLTAAVAGTLLVYAARWVAADEDDQHLRWRCPVPLSGALFALEVVLRHFAVHAFAPIVIASVAGTVINRSVYGDVTEFLIPNQNILAFYVELPAFLILGLLCGLIAVVLMRAIFWADTMGTALQTRWRIPRYLRPMIAGTLLGGLAIFYPHIIGVGYETTSDALTGRLVMHEAIVFVFIKIVAVAITMAGRMGGAARRGAALVRAAVRG